MKREIKFRAWDNSNKQMEYSNIMPDLHFWKWVAYDSSTQIMQFTGLKDGNGKDIYQGDIVSYNQHHFNTEMVKEKVKEVKWNTDRWNIYETQAGESNIEIIGNIHENKELL